MSQFETSLWANSQRRRRVLQTLTATFMQAMLPEYDLSRMQQLKASLPAEWVTDDCTAYHEAYLLRSQTLLRTVQAAHM